MSVFKQQSNCTYECGNQQQDASSITINSQLTSVCSQMFCKQFRTENYMQRTSSQITENEVVQKFVYDEESYEVESQELIRF